VTSVSESGTTLVDGTDFVADLAAGIIYRGSSGSRLRYASGVGSVTVTYTAGVATAPADVPANIKLAVRIILAHLWQADHGGARPDFGEPDAGTVETPAGFAVPRRAYALLEPVSITNLPAFG
jgi:hypothetical protein